MPLQVVGHMVNRDRQVPPRPLFISIPIAPTSFFYSRVLLYERAL
jgi:hypothetical protein